MTLPLPSCVKFLSWINHRIRRAGEAKGREVGWHDIHVESMKPWLAAPNESGDYLTQLATWGLPCVYKRTARWYTAIARCGHAKPQLWPQVRVPHADYHTLLRTATSELDLNLAIYQHNQEPLHACKSRPHTQRAAHFYANQHGLVNMSDSTPVYHLSSKGELSRPILWAYSLKTQQVHLSATDIGGAKQKISKQLTTFISFFFSGFFGSIPQVITLLLDNHTTVHGSSILYICYPPATEITQAQGVGTSTHSLPQGID